MVDLVYLLVPGILGILALYLNKAANLRIRASWISYAAMIATVLIFVSGVITGFSGFSLVISRAIDFSILFALNGISLPFLLLAVLLPILIFPSRRYDIPEENTLFDTMFLLVYISLISMFMSSNLLGLFMFMEIALLSAFAMIFLWGNRNSFSSAMKFLIFTQISSMLILTSFLMIFLYTGSFSLYAMQSILRSMNPAYLIPIFSLVLISALIKFPVFPLHEWMPDAYFDSPTSITSMLSGLFSKLGGYVLLLFIVFLMPRTVSYFSTPVMVLAAVSAFYAAFVALSQRNLKMMFSYSSMLYMSVALLGMMSNNPIGIDGSIFLMVSYGFISPMAFTLTGYLKSQTSTDDMSALGGLMRKLPLFSLFFVIAVFSSIGVPGFSNFIGEFLVFLGAFKYNPVFVAPILSLIIATAYYLYSIKRVLFERFTSAVKKLHDLDAAETIQMGVFSSIIILLGVLPYIIINSINLGGI
ncbi:MAG: NADH-quinone oxidoreductase subunit M [Candidatus Parvarchaeota archaeon]|nr:NADH-quinone oxidoreductase subunit M [Candidatus Parvarchaeota archaeon]